ncbi:hypothetical protein Tco_0820598 [Tanacetum coccineum]|uniref:Uncharacterized protein n=1 Tax=Tanacetum coccineum TaxID=301880 RepID=A0ABQ5AE65_9ASTR
MDGYTHNQLKHKSFEEIQKAFDKQMQWINAFKPMDSEVVGDGSKKRTREELDEESVKRQKLEDDAKKAELKDCLEIVPDENKAINIEPLATKSPIVNWKTHTLGEEMSYYQIMRADGSCKMYKVFSTMLSDFDRKDLVDLYNLVMTRFGSPSPTGYDLFLWGDLKMLFEPNEEDDIWKNQEGYTLIEWKYFDSCGVHSLLMDTVYIHMLVERKYPLTQTTLSRMLNGKLQVDYECDTAYELLRFIKMQLKK